jgi:hypothetical protein
MQWIEPAPAGMATAVEIFLTNDTRPMIEAAFAKDGLRTLRAFGSLRNGSNLGVATLSHACGPIECRIPRDPVIPGQVFGELVCPDTDPQDPGRPVRGVLTEHSGERFELWEVGGYETKPIAA